MALIIEDGTIVTGAQSYVSASDCRIYALARGLKFTDDAAGEQALVRATTWLDSAYPWTGARTGGRGQPLQWPRQNVTDVEGNPIANDEIPQEVVSACCEAAVRELAKPGSLSPDYTPAKRIKSASVDGAVSVEYVGGSEMPISTVIDGILTSLIVVSRLPAIMGKSVRT